MELPRGSYRRAVALSLSLAWAASLAPAAEPGARSHTVGVVFEHLSRTVVWQGEAGASRVRANQVAARAGLELGRGFSLGLTAGLSLSGFDDLVFDGLPVSLELGSTTLKGVVLGAELEAALFDLGDVEIGAAGRFVSSFGLARTWPLEGFAVPGEASGKVNWMEASAGPRVMYRVSRVFAPYLEAAVRWFRVDARMDETLEDLHGSEKKSVSGDVAFSFALGADIPLSERLKVRAKAGIAPFAGGVDGLASVGLAYAF
jgi:hypothetical protein